jgi:hypothetical protein
MLKIEISGRKRTISQTYDRQATSEELIFFMAVKIQESLKAGFFSLPGYDEEALTISEKISA